MLSHEAATAKLKLDIAYQLAHQLREKIPDIMDIWERMVRNALSAARSLQASDLKDSLPEVLENLAQAMECNDGCDHPEVKIAREHGKERSQFPQYTIEQIILEYRFLRRAIFQVLEGDIPDRELDIILNAIEVGISEAASEFSKQQHQFREQFISTLAHDLRNPLTALKMNAEMILRNPEKVGPVQTLATRILEISTRTDCMIQDLLDSNLVQIGKTLPLEIKKFELRSLMKSIVDDMKTIYGERFILNEGNPIFGYWDASLLQRAIENLITNAIKYGDPKGLVKVTILPWDEKVEISVHNEGPPIPAVEQDMIFNHSYRATHAHGGWGIGLHLVKGAAEAHGGVVSVVSRENEGSTFAILIPVDCRATDASTEHIH